MNRTHTRFPVVPPRHAHHLVAETIEWEELPSLARMLRRDELAASTGHVWLSTEPMPLLPPAVGLPAPFAEPIDGMQVREIAGESLFGHLFSDASSGH